MPRATVRAGAASGRFAFTLPFLRSLGGDGFFQSFVSRFADNFLAYEVVGIAIRAARDDSLCLVLADAGQAGEVILRSGVEINFFPAARCQPSLAPSTAALRSRPASSRGGLAASAALAAPSRISFSRSAESPAHPARRAAVRSAASAAAGKAAGREIAVGRLRMRSMLPVIVRRYGGVCFGGGLRLGEQPSWSKAEDGQGRGSGEGPTPICDGNCAQAHERIGVKPTRACRVVLLGVGLQLIECREVG